MLEKDPFNRISLEDVLGHPWTIKEELPDQEEINTEVARCESIVQGQALAWAQ